MKKAIIIGLTAVVVIAAIVVGAVFLLSANNVPKMEFTDSADVINKVIETYAEEQKFFSMGGDTEAPVDGKAGLMNISDTETINYMLHTNDELVAQADEIASYVHAMNANTFTSGSFKLKDASAADSFCTALIDSVLATQWMCGFPEKIVVFNVNGGDYVVYAIGNGDAIDYFKTQLTAVMGESAVLVTEEAVA